MTTTDGAGRYDVSFPGNTTATVAAGHDGYERTFQSAQVVPNVATITTNLRLHRIIRLTAGDSMAVNLRSDLTCGLEDEWICKTLRVAAMADGRLTLAVTADEPLRPGIGVASVTWPSIPEYPCCGAEVQLSVRAGDEVVVDVMLPWTFQEGVVTLRTSVH
jgi:hypothetical protein